MTGLLKCVVLSCAVSLVYGLTSVRDDVNWFKNGQRIKNRYNGTVGKESWYQRNFQKLEKMTNQLIYKEEKKYFVVTGVVNGIMDFNCNNTLNGETVEGECLSKLECTKTGGKVGGLCSLLGSCCIIEKTCDQSTSSKISYFVPPSRFYENCPLTIKIYSEDVCQIRLDFEKFKISRATTKAVPNETGEPDYYEAFKCRNDKFTVENVQKSLGFDHLCGRNEKQHIYIPVSKRQEQITLRFTFISRNEKNVDPPQPEWRIKIRQLECRRSGYEHILTAPSKLMAMYNTLKNKKNPKSDYDLIAPPNCLQYYPNHTGTFESFNYNGREGYYIGNLNYAICFRKTPDICGATYTADGEFQMNQNPYKPGTNKCYPEKPSSPENSHDYIRIPGGKNSAGLYGDYYCNTDFDNNTVTAKALGPLYVGVHTDNYLPNVNKSETDFAEVGFRIRYELQSGNCDNDF